MSLVDLGESVRYQMEDLLSQIDQIIGNVLKGFSPSSFIHDRPFSVLLTVHFGSVKKHIFFYFHTISRFQIFDPNGRHLLSYPANIASRKIKSKSEVENEPEVKGVFNRPAGICFSYHPEPSILIADKDNHQIQVGLIT